MLRDFGHLEGELHMRFTKMEGLGNDYVYLDCTKAAPSDLPVLAQRMSDRHFGVGSDGLICVFPSKTADFKMVMFNADGSQAEMCGNGIRCVGKFVFDKGLTNKTEVNIETLAGVKAVSLSILGGQVDAATVDMGKPAVEELREVSYQGQILQGVPVSMGNPHFVMQVSSVKDYPLQELAALSGQNPTFSEGVNVEIAEILNRHHIRMRVWERGSGETLACGTGACATLAACVSLGLCEREATVTLLGGDLHICWDEASDHIYMTGPCCTVFEGEWPEIMLL